MSKYSAINVRGVDQAKKVQITSGSKPAIETSIIKKWQTLIDTIAKIVQVPSGLIMRLNEENIEVFVKSDTDGNPYPEGGKEELIYGLYCETVIGTQTELLVPDATKSPLWKHNNPDIDLNMISYLGLPINWPDDEVFGTVCLLDNKENYYTQDYKKLLSQVKLVIETDLKLLTQASELANKNSQLEHLNSVKTKFLSLVSHDLRGSLGSVKMFLDLLITDLDKMDELDLPTILKQMRDNVNSSHETLEDLLVWSKNDLVTIEPNLERVDLVGIIEDIFTTIQTPILLKDIEVTKEYFSNEVYVSTDRKMMTVVLRNLLTNATKYTNKHGKIFIRILNENKHHVIEIEDTGIGMSQSVVDNLFSYDKNHSEQGTDGESSAGIGLILIKEFIDKINGSISVTSELGKGSLFRLTI